ncbi:nucleoside triphosphate pyrophosphohydrolase [Neptunicella marina]|uniref:Nucleoside triphosphate pyrophosphohydrolase n=1 Tax=Neptunicella marina TaxID=2125989 RepID=A0A8J6M051_9ALTE|nr:nucleoside triphosphate pyrophosphohydrolase [Neptunicella marina]MBC3766865.1 nucleoside triphosphate pyrophosphohydrolase [Neptunicella marina]
MSSQINRLLDIMARLRDPQTGCPWDIKQDFASVVPYTIEEAYELADAIDDGNLDDIRDELGDLLFQVVFYAQLGKEQQAFDFEQVAQSIADKLVRRHPHVFAEQNVEEADLANQWDAIKQAERAAKGLAEGTSILANIPAGMEPLLKADKIQKRCAKVGFDWPELEPVVDKIHEEIDEVLQEVNAKQVNQQLIEEEVGDLLFAVVNLARHLKVDPQAALRIANRKFEQRFRAVEHLLGSQGKSLQNSSLHEMEAAWQQVKNTSS